MVLPEELMEQCGQMLDAVLNDLLNIISAMFYICVSKSLICLSIHMYLCGRGYPMDVSLHPMDLSRKELLLPLIVVH